MRRMMKKSLSLLLCLVMCLSLFPVAAFADEEIAEESDVDEILVEESAEEQFVAEEPVVEEPVVEEPIAEELVVEECVVEECVVEEPVVEEPVVKDDEAASEVPVRVVLVCEPEDLTLTVYTLDEYGKKQPIEPEEDGSWLLLPGSYFYDAACEGYVPVEKGELTVEASLEPLRVELRLVSVDAAEEASSAVLSVSEEAQAEPDAAPAPDAEVQEIVASGTCGENLTWTLDEQGTLTISGTGVMNDYTLDVSHPAPWKRSEINTVFINYGVANIGINAFSYCRELTSITIPDSVTSIGNCALCGCSSLTSITFPDSVTSIGSEAFEDCSGLTSITLPDSVTSIGDYAFAGCSGLTSITIPERVTSIGNGAYYKCGMLSDVFFGGTIRQRDERIGNGWDISENDALMDAVWHCSDGTISSGMCGNSAVWSLDDAGTLTIFGTGAMTNWSSGSSPFYSRRSSIKCVVINNGVTNIGDFAFYYCSKLTSITIPASVTSIGSSAFFHCSGLTSITIPASVTSIGSSAFWGCSKLTSVTIPASVTSIGSYAFSGCSSLKTAGPIGGGYNIEFGWSTSIPTDAFEDCNGLTNVTIPASVTSIGDYAFAWCSGLTSITIPASVTSIGTDAFRGCSGLTSITIPASVTSIGSSAFYSCSGLKTAGPIGGGYNIEFGWTQTIPPSAFYNCSSLTSVTIPASVTSIGTSAFYNCSSLTSITIPESVTSIGEHAFSNCSSLPSITIPGSVTSIGGYAFSGCSSLSEIRFTGPAPSFGTSCFYNVNATAYYPVKADGWTDSVLQNYGGTISWCKYGSFRIEFDANGGSGAPEAQTKTYGEPLNLSSTVPTREGYRFLGWATSSTATSAQYQPGESYTEEDDATLYAVWARVYTISYDANGGSGAPASQTKIHGTALTLRSTSPTRSGYRFLGWATSSDATAAQYQPGGRYTEEADVTLYAVWIRVYTVSYNANGGSGAPASQTKTHGTALTLSSTRPTREGYDFLGWATSSTATSAQYQPGGRYTIDASVTLYAVWKVGLIDSGTCGYGLSWTLDGTGKLTISGSGWMYDYSLDSIDTRAPWALNVVRSLVIESGVRSIGDYAFTACSLTEASLPSTLKTIGYMAFCGCTELNGITVPEGTTSIGESAFLVCENLASVSLPSTLTQMGSGAFMGCSKLKSVVIPTGLISIPTATFMGCSNLENVSIPSNISVIHGAAFANCSALQSIVIPASVTDIAISAFDECSALTTIVFQGAAPRLYENCFYHVSATAWYPANASGWTSSVRQDYGGAITWKAIKSGWNQIDGKWYYYNSNGTAATGWKQVSGKWYYFDAAGVMQTGWVKYNGKWYYFNSSGVMQTGWLKSGSKWYYFESSGAMVTGWKQISSKWYYFESSGIMVTGWRQISGKWYHFASSGSMDTGWLKSGSKWYYFESSGAMKTGWLKDGGKWYYLDSSGAMLANTSKNIGGKVYYFNSSGVCTNP